MLNAGQLRQVVRIEQRSTSQDDAGEPLNTWVLFAERRAEIERQSGREVWASQERLGRVPTIFHLRALVGVTPEMRLQCNGSVYDIVSAIDPDGMGVELTITCVEHIEEAA